MSFLIARCGTSIPSRTVSSSAWTSRRAKPARTQPHLQHSPGTSMCQDLPLLLSGNAMPTGVPIFPTRCGRISNGIPTMSTEEPFRCPLVPEHRSLPPQSRNLLLPSIFAFPFRWNEPCDLAVHCTGRIGSGPGAAQSKVVRKTVSDVGQKVEEKYPQTQQ
jgi:hypothetical protein